MNADVLEFLDAEHCVGLAACLCQDPKPMYDCYAANDSHSMQAAMCTRGCACMLPRDPGCVFDVIKVRSLHASSGQSIGEQLLSRTDGSIRTKIRRVSYETYCRATKGRQANIL